MRPPRAQRSHDPPDALQRDIDQLDFRVRCDKHDIRGKPLSELSESGPQQREFRLDRGRAIRTGCKT